MWRDSDEFAGVEETSTRLEVFARRRRRSRAFCTSALSMLDLFPQ